jgi:CheY-like chemotaxis protein
MTTRTARSLGALLGCLGTEVRVALSGHQAIELAQQFRPQLVVLDINMPGLDGFETFARLKHEPWAHGTTFVAHTGATQELRPAAIAAGFHHFLVKGATVADFKAIVDHLLTRNTEPRVD